ncbi:MAG: RNA methyltransferase [Clostridia bacterium]|nr:RNA methyltransferase [Clostridia bacterium]
MKQITSAENSAVKLLKKLAKKKFRQEAGLFIVEGLRACSLAVESPFDIDSFYLSESFFAAHKSANSFWEQFPCSVMPDKIFNSCSDTETPQGILCTAKIPEKTFGLNKDCYVYLDNVRDPGNIGTIIRTADALGFDGVLLSDGCADLYSPKVVRSTMGSVFALEIVCDCNVSLLSNMKKQGYKILASALSDNCTDLYRAEWNDKLVFVLGNEANGISDEVLNVSDIAVKIPMYGSAESFNVSIAAALLMGEAARRTYEKQ